MSSKNDKNVSVNIDAEEQARKERIAQGLDMLRACDSTMRNEQKKIRRMLRKNGHRGGLMNERNAQREQAFKVKIAEAQKAKDAKAHITK